MDRFSRNSAQNRELLAGVVLRTPDVTFERETAVDLGGVTGRLICVGEAHTKGDELIFVEPDRTLISGDVVQNRCRISPTAAARLQPGSLCSTNLWRSTPRTFFPTTALQETVR